MFCAEVLSKKKLLYHEKDGILLMKKISLHTFIQRIYKISLNLVINRISNIVLLYFNVIVIIVLARNKINVFGHIIQNIYVLRIEIWIWVLLIK